MPKLDDPIKMIIKENNLDALKDLQHTINEEQAKAIAFKSIKYGSRSLFFFCIETFKLNINMENNHHHTPAMHAIKHNKMDLFLEITTQGGKVKGTGGSCLSMSWD